MFDKLFKRKKEDFICENCSTRVMGDGYTNHCPHCLWSKHVDKNPGDRAETCSGDMKPCDVEQKGKDIVLTHKCQTCGFSKKNKLSKDDNFEKALEIVKENQD